VQSEDRRMIRLHFFGAVTLRELGRPRRSYRVAALKEMPIRTVTILVDRLRVLGVLAPAEVGGPGHISATLSVQFSSYCSTVGACQIPRVCQAICLAGQFFK